MAGALTAKVEVADFDYWDQKGREVFFSSLKISGFNPIYSCSTDP